MLALVAACGGGAGGSDGADVEAAPRSLPEPVCDLLDEWEETERPLLDRQGVFQIDEAALGELLADRREVLGDLAERTRGELRSLLEDHLLSQAAFDEVMLDGWDRERTELAASHDDQWVGTVYGEEVTRDDGERMRTSDYGYYRDLAYERLVLGCRAPELAEGPPQDTSEEAPPGRLVFVRPDDVHDFDAGARLMATDSAGRHPRELPLPEEWTLWGSA